jgi:hypothetical protein
VQKEEEMTMEEKVAFLVAPAAMHKTPEYAAAFNLIEARHPELRIVSDEELWKTTKEFVQTHKQWLKSHAVTDFYILTAPDGTVGFGIFQMWRRLTKYQNSKTRALFPTGEDGGFEEIEDCELTVVSKDWARYAVPVVKAATVPT